MRAHPYRRLTARDVIMLVAGSHFRPFGPADWMGFQGCQDAAPLICEGSADLDACLIVDGPVICLVSDDADWLQLDTRTGEITLA
jgi:hypothetical protein